MATLSVTSQAAPRLAPRVRRAVVHTLHLETAHRAMLHEQAGSCGRRPRVKGWASALARVWNPWMSAPVQAGREICACFLAPRLLALAFGAFPLPAASEAAGARGPAGLLMPAHAAAQPFRTALAGAAAARRRGFIAAGSGRQRRPGLLDRTRPSPSPPSRLRKPADLSWSRSAATPRCGRS